MNHRLDYVSGCLLWNRFGQVGRHEMLERRARQVCSAGVGADERAGENGTEAPSGLL